MHKEPGIPMFAASVASLIGVISWLGGVAAFSQQTAGFSPILKLEKPVYLVGESIRFWIGVTTQTDIPEALNQSAVVHVVWPDGRTTDQHVSWPRDGDPSRGWEGGWSFPDRSPSPGRYVVCFEFAGQRTADRPFEIIANPFARSIGARWIFPDTNSGGGIHVRGAVLHIENKSGRVLRVAEPGLLGSEVGLAVHVFQPPSSGSTIVPPSAILRADQIPSFSFEKLDWSNQSKWPMIFVPDGGSADRNLTLESSYSFRAGQDYEITVSTDLTVFVGEPDDSDARLFPLRIPVSAKTRFRW
ncbi:MAG: hypothetical protein ABSG56_39085 [Bryobacteraceae bacterium]|jgi:hypothetical protein